MISITRKCRRCQEVKTIDFFSVRRGRCKKCEAELRLERYYKDPQKTLSATQRWRKKNPDKRSAQNKRWYLKHKEEKDAKNLLWRENNKEKYNNYSIQWRKNNPGKKVKWH